MRRDGGLEGLIIPESGKPGKVTSDPDKIEDPLQDPLQLPTPEPALPSIDPLEPTLPSITPSGPLRREEPVPA